MRKRWAGVLAVSTCLLSACVSMPDSGPVRAAPQDQDAASTGSFDYEPAGPRPGAGPAEVVAGFLDAMREAPLTYAPARAFLTPEGAAAWTPGRSTIVYDDGDLELAVGAGAAELRISESAELDDRGSWLGDPTGGAGQVIELELVTVEGEWRIVAAPDALIIPRSHFDSRYERYDLHYVDPTSRVVVPEPVYVPGGAEAATELVSGLLSGPSLGLAPVEQTFFPVGTRLEMPVSISSGVATVALSEEFLRNDRDQIEMAFAQLAWTLRQVPGIDDMRVVVDDTPVDRTTGASVRSVLGFTTYDPSVPGTAPGLIGLRDGLVTGGELGDPEAGAAEDPAPISDSFEGLAIRSLARSIADGSEAGSVAAVSADGSTVYLAPVRPALGSQDAPTVLYQGSDVVALSFDRTGRLWMADRTTAGTRLLVVTGDRVRVLRAPGITGTDVDDLAVSRDGSRVAALADGRVLVARIGRLDDGRPGRLLPAREVADAAALGDGESVRLADLAWSSPSVLAVLTRADRTLTRVVAVSVDGSTGFADVGEDLDPIFAPGVALLTWPGAEAPAYVVTRRDRLYTSLPDGGWSDEPLPPEIELLAFPG